MCDKINKFITSLNLNRHAVGVKFLFTEEEYNNCSVKEAKTKLSYCMMINIASSGKALRVKNKHFLCSSSAKAFGIKEVDEDSKSGKNYFSYGMYSSLGVAKRVFNEVTYLDNKIYGLEIRPVQEFINEPDIVIIITTPYNIMRIIQGYSYEFGFAKNIRFVGNQGLCSELTIRPYVYNDINISMLCSNTRHSCNWKETELGAGMPYKIFKKVAKGVLETLNHVEPDYKKDEIIKRAKEKKQAIHIKKEVNYYDSCLGVAKLD